MEEYIKKNYESVEDKPGYVWFNKRNFQIISNVKKIILNVLWRYNYESKQFNMGTN